MRIGFNWMKAASAVTVWLWFSLALGGKAIPLPELVNPNSIKADAGNIYIADETTVYIYNLKNFKLKKKFGKTGEGPGEFMGNIQSGTPPLTLDVSTDELVINSSGKVSFYSKDGQYIREIKTSDRSRRFIPFGKGFVGNLNMVIDNVRYRTLNLYDENLGKIKLLFKRPHSLQGRGGGFNPLEGPQRCGAYKDKLFVCWETDFTVRVFDPSGKEVNTITQPFRKRKVTEEDKKRIENFLKNHPRFKALYPILKPLRFPGYFPVVGNMIVNDGKIHVICRTEVQGRAACYIFDAKGKSLKQTFIELQTVDELQVYPFTIKGDRLYQLVEDEDEEAWYLHVSGLE